MSKELEALEEIRDFRYGKDKLLVCQTEMYSTIKKGLERLEAIDNAKPSEALNGLEFICKILNEKRIDIKWLFKNEYNTIQQALQRLKQIDNSNPSEAMEYVENIQSEIEWALEFNNKKIEDYDLEYFDTIKQYILKSQEQEKENVEYKRVLKIIFEKNVDIKHLKWCINNPKKLTTPLLNYNIDMNKNEQLTKEEFDLLKRWLENGTRTTKREN